MAHALAVATSIFAVACAATACTSTPSSTPVAPDASVDGLGGGDGAADAAEAAADVNADVPFVCGTSTCSPATQYCVHVLPEGGLTAEGGPDLSDQCIAIPASCAGMPTCACIEPLSSCEAGVEGEGCVQGVGVEVTCPTL